MKINYDNPLDNNFVEQKKASTRQLTNATSEPKVKIWFLGKSNQLLVTLHDISLNLFIRGYYNKPNPGWTVEYTALNPFRNSDIKKLTDANKFHIDCHLDEDNNDIIKEFTGRKYNARQQILKELDIYLVGADLISNIYRNPQHRLHSLYEKARGNNFDLPYIIQQANDRHNGLYYENGSPKVDNKGLYDKIRSWINYKNNELTLVDAPDYLIKEFEQIKPNDLASFFK